MGYQPLSISLSGTYRNQRDQTWSGSGHRLWARRKFINLSYAGYDVTGIDLVEDVISDAKAKAIECHLNLNFVVGNVLEMNRFFKEGEFDIVIESGLFHTFK